MAWMRTATFVVVFMVMWGLLHYLIVVPGCGLFDENCVEEDKRSLVGMLHLVAAWGTAYLAIDVCDVTVKWWQRRGRQEES